MDPFVRCSVVDEILFVITEARLREKNNQYFSLSSIFFFYEDGRRSFSLSIL